MFEEAFPEYMHQTTYKTKLPWLLNGLRASIKRKHELRNIYYKNPCQENELIYKTHNKRASLMRIAEWNYYEEQLDLNNYDIRKSWKPLKEIVGRNGKFENLSNGYNVNGTINKIL